MGVDAPPSIKLCPYFIELKKNKQNSTVLEIRESQESEEELKYGKVRKQLSKSKCLTIPQIQFDDLSFSQNAISRNHQMEISLWSGKVRESQGR